MFYNSINQFNILIAINRRTAWDGHVYKNHILTLQMYMYEKYSLLYRVNNVKANKNKDKRWKHFSGKLGFLSFYCFDVSHISACTRHELCKLFVELNSRCNNSGPIPKFLNLPHLWPVASRIWAPELRSNLLFLLFVL